MGGRESLFDDRELAYRVAEYVRGALAIQNGPKVSEIEAAERRAAFDVAAKDGKRVRITVEDTSLAATAEKYPPYVIPEGYPG